MAVAVGVSDGNKPRGVSDGFRVGLLVKVTVIVGDVVAVEVVVWVAVGVAVAVSVFVKVGSGVSVAVLDGRIATSVLVGIIGSICGSGSDCRSDGMSVRAIPANTINNAHK
jgi:hypothetical protein